MAHDMGMDHGNMGHGGMDHGDMGPMCSMNMIFTWDTDNLCIVFKWWHIQTTIGLWLSLLAIVGLGAGYEFLRYRSRVLDSQTLEPQTRNVSGSPRQKIARSAFYAFQVAYSFFLMLIFMTYNGWAMLAVTAGAFVGFYIWGERSSRGMACH
ncbi:copper transport protein Ctr2p [Trichomonascus vanleenenianus]|uniref:low-affinity Cu transporter n=1 Tax=Trichomonascus vanleenenianus TaxID=2268995 RepID=UPI003ECB624C